MSFTASKKGTGFQAGFFLANPEKCLRETANVPASHPQAVERDGHKVVPMGAVIPENGAGAVGILYEDIDVSKGDAPGSVVTEGVVYGDLLPAPLEDAAATALKGITVEAAPTVTRP